MNEPNDTTTSAEHTEPKPPLWGSGGTWNDDDGTPDLFGGTTTPTPDDEKPTINR